MMPVQLQGGRLDGYELALADGTVSHFVVTPDSKIPEMYVKSTDPGATVPAVKLLYTRTGRINRAGFHLFRFEREEPYE